MQENCHHITNATHIQNPTLIDLLLTINNTCIALIQQNQELQLQNKLLQDQINDLNKKLNINSSNSSMPPSTDIFDKPVKPLNNRIKTGKKSGGQTGHQGNNLEFVTNPNDINETITYKVHSCTQCGSEITDHILIDTRQTKDIIIKTIITNYEIYMGKCQCGCENIFETKIPHGVSYGNTIKSAMTYLHNKDLIPTDRLTQTAKDLFDIQISEGTIYNWQNEIANNLAPYNKHVTDRLLTEPTIHADESGINVGGKNHWLHVLCNQYYTKYDIHKKRGREAINEINSIPKYTGNLITDAYCSYFGYANISTHGLCNAHLLRELKSVDEFYNMSFAKQLHDLLITMNQISQDQRNNPNIQAQLLDLKLDLKNQYDVLLDLASTEVLTITNEKWQKKVTALIYRLKKRKDNYLAFLDNPDIPFTNNQAERDIRMIKVKQKISGGFRKKKSAENFLVIRGFISTMNKLNHNIMEALNKIIINSHDFNIEPRFTVNTT